MLAERLSEMQAILPQPGISVPLKVMSCLSRRLLTRSLDLWGDHASWNLDGRSHPHEANFLKLDTSKARTYLNWQPVLPLETSLEWIVEWYKAVEAGKDLRKVTSAQIERYESILSRTGASMFHASQAH